MAKIQFLRMPFLIGAHHKDESSSGGFSHQIQDAYISSFAFLVLLVSAGGALVLLQWTSPAKANHILLPTLEICISVLLTTTVAIIISFNKCTPLVAFRKSHKNLLQWPDVTQKPLRQKLKMVFSEIGRFIRRVFKYNTVMVGLIGFLIPSLMLHFMQMVAHLMCMPVFVECGRHFQYLISAMYQMVRMVFMVSVYLFVIKFCNAQFASIPRVWYSIVLITSSVLTSWFDISFQEIIETFIDKQDAYGINHIQYRCMAGANQSVFLDKYTYCLAKETMSYKIFNKAANYLYPLNIEFSLLILEMLCHIISNVSHEHIKQTEGTETDDTELELDEYISPENLEDTTEVVTVSNVQNTSPSLTPPTQEIATVSGNGALDHVLVHLGGAQEEQTKDSCKRMQKACSKISKSAPLIFSIVCCAAVNIAHLTSGILTYFDNYSPFQWSRLAFRVFLILIMLRAYQVSRDFESVYRSYSSYELVVLVSSIGGYIFNFLAFVAEIAWWTHGIFVTEGENLVPVQYAFVDPISNVLNICEEYIQSGFIMYASRVKSTTRGDSNKNIWFKSCVLYVAISNFIQWAINSFILNKNSVAIPIPFYYFKGKAWSGIIHIILPFALFYRFNSFVLLMAAWMQQIKTRKE